MPYVERVTKAGNTIEIERYFTSRYKKKGISRGDKVKPTKEEQEKVNTRQAERKLRILINANYGYGDYHLVLDYIRRKGEPDRTPEQMRQDIDVFLRECRKEYRKAGLEFKYIHVMEIGKKGARHHHLVVNKIDTEILQRCWYKAYEGHNRVKVFPLDDSGNYAELASYLIKYTGTHKKGTDGALQGKHDGKKEVKTADGGVWRRAAQITYVHITKDENGLEQLEAQGYMLSWWLNKRCIYPQIVATGTNQYLINLMVKNNCGSAAGTKRRFPLLTFLAQETIDGVAVEYANEVYAQLGQEVKARAQAGKLGYDILLNERERLFGFYLYKGNDLTATNTEGNTPCIFSRDFDNVNEQEYTASIENCGNFIYVQGAADDDGSQPVTTVDGEGATGLDLVEVFCDATDIARKYQQGETEVTIPLNTYIAMLKTRGGAELENYGKNINFVSNINTNSNLKFKADFDLGDRITCKETKWGIQIDARITEATETYQKGEETIEATFGDSLPTLVDQIRKVR